MHGVKIFVSINADQNTSQHRRDTEHPRRQNDSATDVSQPSLSSVLELEQ